MARRTTTTREDPDIQIEMPIRLALSLAVFAKSYQSMMRCHIVHKSNTLALFLRSLNKTSYCQISMQLTTDDCRIKFFDESLAETEEETKLDISAEDLVRNMTLLRSRGDTLRIGSKSTWPYIHLEAGYYMAPKSSGKSQSNSKTGKKRSADIATSERIWSSRSGVKIGLCTDATAEMVIKAVPAKRFVIRIDQNYLLRCLTSQKRASKDKQVVTIWFTTETKNVTHNIKGTANADDDEDDDEDEETKRMRAELNGGGGGGRDVSMTTMQHTVIVPTRLNFTFTAPGSSTVADDILDIVDRRNEWAEGSVQAKSGQSGLDWRDDCDDDAEKAIENKKDKELGIDNSDAAMAELFSFPLDLEEEPASFTYSVENLIRQLNSAVFSRYATLQWTDKDKGAGNLWICSSMDVGEGKLTGLCAAYQVDQA